MPSSSSKVSASKSSKRFTPTQDSRGMRISTCRSVVEQEAIVLGARVHRGGILSHHYLLRHRWSRLSSHFPLFLLLLPMFLFLFLPLSPSSPRKNPLPPQRRRHHAQSARRASGRMQAGCRISTCTSPHPRMSPRVIGCFKASRQLSFRPLAWQSAAADESSRQLISLRFAPSAASHPLLLPLLRLLLLPLSPSLRLRRYVDRVVVWRTSFPPRVEMRLPKQWRTALLDA